MADLFEITGLSLKSAAEGTFKNPGVWIIMALLSAVIYYIIGYFLETITTVSPLAFILIIVAVLLGFVVCGAYVKTLRNETPGFKNFGKTIWEGFLYTIVITLYNCIIIALAVFMVCGTGMWGILLTNEIDVIVYLISMAVCWIIFGALLVIALVLTNPASAAFGRTGKFSSAFKLTNLFEMINAITWKKSIFGTILQIAVGAVLLGTIFACAYLLTFIPVAGEIISIIFVGFFLPFAMIFLVNYSARLYEGVNHE